MMHKEDYEFYNNFLTAYKENIVMQQNPNISFKFEANGLKYSAMFGVSDFFIAGMCRLFTYLDNKIVNETDYNIIGNLIITRQNRNILVNGFDANMKNAYFSPNAITVAKIDNEYYHIHNKENVTNNIEKLTKNFCKNESITSETYDYNYIPIFVMLLSTARLTKNLIYMYAMLSDESYTAHLQLSI